MAACQPRNSIAWFALLLLATACPPTPAWADQNSRSLARAVCSPEQLGFGEVPLPPLRATAIATVVVRNPGATPLLISEARIIGGDFRDFAVLDGPLQGLLEGGSSLTISVRFAPRSAGPRHATLQLSFAAVRTPSIEIPLSGRGVPGAGESAPGAPTATLVSGPLLTTSLASAMPEPWLPVNIRWSPAKGGHPLRYQLQLSENGEPFEEVVLASPQARDCTRLLHVSRSEAPTRYRYRVRTLTKLSAGEWVTGREFSLLSVPLDDPAVRWTGDWRISEPGFLGVGVAHTRLSGRGSFATTTRVPSGVATSMAWVTHRGDDRGVASVLVDEGREQQLDLYSPGGNDATPVSIAATCDRASGHSITIRSLGKHHPAAHGERVDIGAVVLLTELPEVPDADPLQESLGFVDESAYAQNVATDGQQAPPEGGADEHGATSGWNGVVDPGASAALRLAFTTITPNPSAANSNVTFTTPRDGRVRLHVLDISGRLLRTLIDDNLKLGSHSAGWDGIDGQGSPVQPGMYFAILRFEGQTLLARMVRR